MINFGENGRRRGNGRAARIGLTDVLNGNGRQMRHLVDEVLMVRSRAPRCACVEREGAQYCSRAGHYGRGPTRPQPVG